MVSLCDHSPAASKSQELNSQKNWCCQTGLNCRPLHYQWSALPLSYGSMPGCENRPKGPNKAGRSLPQGPISRKRAGPTHPKRSQSGLDACGFLQPGQLRADPVPHFLSQRLQRLDGADHDLEFDHFAGLVEFDEIDAL